MDLSLSNQEHLLLHRVLFLFLNNQKQFLILFNSSNQYGNLNRALHMFQVFPLFHISKRNEYEYFFHLSHA